LDASGREALCTKGLRTEAELFRDEWRTGKGHASRMHRSGAQRAILEHSSEGETNRTRDKNREAAGNNSEDIATSVATRDRLKNA
jgi:hypothetical protein